MIDYYLSFLVKAANVAGLNTFVVLSIGGLTVNGRLMPESEFALGLMEDLVGDELEKEYKQKFAKLINEHSDVVGAPSNQSTDEKPLYVHLNNVTLITGTNRIQLNCWRCKIEEVSGFYIGEIK